MGRFKKRPTFIKSLRVEQDIKEFLESLENANDFVVLQIKNTEEYKQFIIKKQEQDLSKYPSLPFEEWLTTLQGLGAKAPALFRTSYST